MNYTDAERISAYFANSGASETKNAEDADIIIAVSCGVRQGAEERIVSWLAKARKENKRAQIILTGCLAHREDIKKRLEKVVDIFVPAGKWEEFGIRNSEFKNPVNSVYTVNSIPARGGSAFGGNPIYTTSYRAYIPIMTGCNNFCSYCVVPYARGREVSRPPEEILKEIKNLLEKGYKEIFLLGQNVNSYQGIDKNGQKWNFANLIRKINARTGNFWIKFVSSHPKDINRDFIEALKDCAKVSPNLHLPLQSGSNHILERMNRQYTREYYLEIISKIRQKIPRIIFSTDIIVGFPGETQKDFRDSLEIVKKVGFEMLYALKYSPRPETAAYKLKDYVPAKTKKLRQQKLDATWKKIALEKNQRFLGQEITILIDKIKTKPDNKNKLIYCAIGKTFEHKEVAGESLKPLKQSIIGQWATIKIEEVGPLGLHGELLSVKK